MSAPRIRTIAAAPVAPTHETACLPPFARRSRSIVGVRTGITLLVFGAIGQSGRVLADDVTLPAVTVKAKSQDDAPQHLGTPINGGALGARTQLDTPFSTTVVKSDDLAERQVSKLGDVFALDAAVSDNSGAYSSWASYVTVRGLPLDWQNAYRIDGKPFLSYAITLPYEHFEQIELLKGSSGFMYGFGSPGGLVNYVTKKPSDTPVRSIELGYQSNSLWSEHIDLGGRAGTEGRFGYRLNATHEEGRTYNDGSLRRDALSLALDARLTQDLSWEANALYQHRNSTGQTPSISTGQYVGSSLPGVISGASQELVGGGQHLSNNLQLYSTGLRYRLAPDWTLSASTSHSVATRSRNEGILFLQDAGGDYADYRSDSREGHRFDQGQAVAQGLVRTGALEHQVVLGASWQKQLNDYSSNSVYQQIGAGNLYRQNTNDYFSSTDFALYRDSDITQRAVFASDTVKLSERWSVLAGLRHTDYVQNSYSVAGAQASDYAKNGVLTPTLALMFKPTSDTTVYTSYVESLEQGATVGIGFTNDGDLLKPLKSKQYEVGVKTDHERWSATAALFRIERAAEYANGDNVLVQDGLSIYQGMELGASTRLGSQWQLGGNLMLLDATYQRGSSNEGHRVAGAPEVVATAQLSYAVAQLPGLKLSADAKYTGATLLDAPNALKLPGYTLANLAASYRTRISGHDMTFRVAVNNLTNRRYWEYQYENYIKPGDPRTVSVGARLDF